MAWKWKKWHGEALQQVLMGVGVLLLLAAIARRIRQNAAEGGADAEERPADAPIDVTPLPGIEDYPLTARLTGYYPVGPGASEAEKRQEGGNVDRRGRPLYSLQSYLSGRAPYVSVAVDLAAFPTYGEEIRVYELDRKYGRPIVLRAVDTGEGLRGKGTSALDLRVDTKEQAYALTGEVHYARPQAAPAQGQQVA